MPNSKRNLKEEESEVKNQDELSIDFNVMDIPMSQQITKRSFQRRISVQVQNDSQNYN